MRPAHVSRCPTVHCVHPRVRDHLSVVPLTVAQGLHLPRPLETTLLDELLQDVPMTVLLFREPEWPSEQ